MPFVTRVRNSRFFHSHRRDAILLLSFVVGLLSGLAAVLLKNVVHDIDRLLTEGFSTQGPGWRLLLYPVIGILLTVIFVRFILKDSISHGITRILYAISRKNSLIKPHNTYSSMLAGAATVGFGGSVGLEAPIVLTGSALGSRIGRFFRLNYKTITLLVGCGATGAIAGIFKAPIAGVGFTLEVLMLDLTFSSLVPLMISAVTASSVAWFLMGSDVLFSVQLNEIFSLPDLPWYLLLGILAGLVSAYFGHGIRVVEGYLGKFHSPWKRWAIGGVVLALLIYLFPPLYGEGYEALRSLLSDHPANIFEGSWFMSVAGHTGLFLGLLAIVILIKVIATAITTGAGGVGGIFAPSLFIGGFTGFFLVNVINQAGWIKLPVKSFVLVGMAGVMSGVMHAPLTAMFLIAEITGGYQLFIPLMLTVAVAYVTSRYLQPHSVYNYRLAKRGELITHNKDKAVLSLMDVAQLIETDFKVVKPKQTLRELVNVVAHSNRNIFPVVEGEQHFLGLIIMENLRHVMFETEKYDQLTCADLMYYPEHFVSLSDSMEEVAIKFQKSGKYNMVVLDGDKYVGCVSRARVFSKYRELLKDFSEE
ncbi:MAG: chloride channel protein [Bacteroidales bacterium]|nr:chloride channel protein [Bacteroidales bacterium]